MESWYQHGVHQQQQQHGGHAKAAANSLSALYSTVAAQLVQGGLQDPSAICRAIGENKTHESSRVQGGKTRQAFRVAGARGK